MEKYSEEIRRYLHKEMNESEKDAFEARCREDADLKEALVLAHLIKEKAANERKKEIRKELQTIIDSEKKTEANPSPLWPYVTVIAAALALLFLFIFLWNREATLTPDQLFSQFYETPKENLTTMGSNQVEETRQRAIAYYNEKKFDQAIPEFEALIDQGGENDTINFYLAISQLEQSQDAEAIVLLETIDTTDKLLMDRSDWYLALAMLRAGRTEEAVTRLGEISTENGHLFQFQAEKILEAMN